MRPFSDKAYGIPPEQVVGSSVVAELQVKDGAWYKNGDMLAGGLFGIKRWNIGRGN